ncbi:MAG TPA: bifunctional 2-methylcitrate dehydratase/aconitate hydratase, partial [Opitutaceae bacterium]|nr:bifunctional 2-methylcitrate dehydratase/aconitate hydratase [Opitutaceae bacterium]
MSARATPAAAAVPDAVIADIAAYVDDYRVLSEPAREAAHYCLMDGLGCALEALAYPDCTRLLGPVVPGTRVPHGARVPGTAHELDPVEAAFNLGVLVRWLDYNDAFYGRTVVHPADGLAAILAAADWKSRERVAAGHPPLLMREVLDAAIKAYEVMGSLALENAYTTAMKLDHVLLVKVASAAVVTKLLGGTREAIVSAVSNAWIDGQTLATFRRAGAGSRKSWAAADAASRGVWLALLALKGEMGYASALTARTWGFYDVLSEGQPFRFQRPYGVYVVENVQFKISYPAAFHAQTAAEAAIALHPQVRGRLHEVARVELWSHAYGMGILDKTGPLANVADRDHCLQYVVAVGMIFGRLDAADYEDAVAADPRIDELRAKMTVIEDERYSREFLAPDRRSNANAIRVSFTDGTDTGRIEVEFPVGHPRRRKEGIPLLVEKFERNVARVYAAKQRRRILELWADRKRLSALPVNELMDALV